MQTSPNLQEQPCLKLVEDTDLLSKVSHECVFLRYSVCVKTGSEGTGCTLHFIRKCDVIYTMSPFRSGGQEFRAQSDAFVRLHLFPLFTLLLLLSLNYSFLLKGKIQIH